MKKKFTTLLISLILLLISNLQAQDNDHMNQPTKAWINLGYGVAVSKDLSGVGLITNAQYDSKIGLIGLRFLKADDIAVHSGFSNYLDDISELSITYGYSHNFGILNLSATTGIGSLWGEERSPGADHNFSVVTIPVQGSIKIQPLPIFGLGIMMSTTVNSRSTISGAYFVAQLGRLR